MSHHKPDKPSPEAAPPSSGRPRLRGRHALAEVAHELAQVKPEEYATINVNVQQVVTTIIGCAPKLRVFIGEIKKSLPQFPLELLVKLETYAFAAGLAHSRYVISLKPPEELAAMVDDLILQREILVAEVSLLGKRGILDSRFLAALNGTTGYANVAFDVIAVAEAITDNWDSIEHRSGLQLKEVERAEKLAEDVAVAVGAKSRADDPTESPADLRVRTFTLLVQRWDEVRRAMTYLRWKEGDIDELAPSVYSIGRSVPHKKQDQTDGTDAAAATTAGTTAASGAAAGTGGTASAGATASTGATTVTPANASAAPTAVVPPGMPGHDPFAH